MVRPAPGAPGTIGSVMTYAVLLRGINVGGNNRVPMAELRACLEGLGGTGVATYLQSGNAVVTTDLDGDALCRGVADRFGVPVMARTHAELAAVVDANPFPAAAAKPTTLHVAFLSGQPEPERFAALDSERFLPDEVRLGHQALYLHFPNGAGRSKMTPAALARLGVDATARNWNTVLALLRLTAA
jgi:uncharacterized protein (DUF1697 family)